ncbi:type II secretion protein F, partial [Streptomyces sp. SID8455]|nr:type II secretion protein F [Streptomyces sp. SID8455]
MHAAALCAGAAVWLAAMRDPGVRRARVLFVDGPAEPWRAWPPLLRARRLVVERREWWCVPVAVLLAVLGASVLPLIAGAVAVPLVRRWVRARARRRQRERAGDTVAVLCGAVVGELRAGQEPGQAL